MLVRLFTGPSWASARTIDDYEFDVLPAISHQVAIASGTTWRIGKVLDVAHRCVDGGGAADVALLLGPLSTSPFSGEALPLTGLDGAAPAAAPEAGAPRAGPWSR